MQTDVREALERTLCNFERLLAGKPVRDATETIAEARAALAASPQEQAEPVAWGQLGMLNGRTFLRMSYDRTPYPPPPSVVRNLNLVPLYASPKPAQAEPEGWQQLYRRAINEANGLTNYVEDRPELRSAEKRLAKIEEEARALAAAPKRTEG